MTAVFVHGVPETTQVWDSLISHIERDDVVTLGLPGFGSALPVGFEPTMDRYAQWLSDELATFDGVDLVAHDWGAILSLKVLADQPSNVRSWASDMGDLGPDFQWHDTAKLWQTPGEGEAFMDGVVDSSPDERAGLLMAVGVPESGAGAMGASFDRTMADAILTLYRSATDVGNEWGPGIDRIQGPGLLIESMNDPFRAAERVVSLGQRTGATIAPLPDAGHWWMLDSTAEAAALLQNFWSGLS